MERKRKYKERETQVHFIKTSILPLQECQVPIGDLISSFLCAHTDTQTHNAKCKMQNAKLQNEKKKRQFRSPGFEPGHSRHSSICQYCVLWTLDSGLWTLVMTIITWYSNLKARNPNHWTTTDVFVHDTCIPKSEFDFSWNDRMMMTKQVDIWYIHVPPKYIWLVSLQRGVPLEHAQ